METLLTIDQVSMTFGGLKALNNISFDIKKGEIVGLIGPNGAGKTTLFNCLTQFYKDYEGTFTLHADPPIDLRDLDVTEVIDAGLARTFQNIELIPDLSILDNLLIGAHRAFKDSFVEELLKFPRATQEEKRLTQKALKVLDVLGLSPLKDFYVKGQPYGILKRVEIARTLMSDPKLIVLDEPAAGLNDQETDQLETIIKLIQKEFAVTLLIIEHDMGFVMNVCDRVCAINFGEFIAIDTPSKIQKNKAVQEAYLGRDDDA